MSMKQGWPSIDSYKTNSVSMATGYIFKTRLNFSDIYIKIYCSFAIYRSKFITGNDTENLLNSQNKQFNIYYLINRVVVTIEWYDTFCNGSYRINFNIRVSYFLCCGLAKYFL